MPGDADRDLRRFERDAMVACGVMAVAALALTRGVEAPLGVVAGGLLMALSYRAVKGGVDALVGRVAVAGAGVPPAAKAGEPGAPRPAGEDGAVAVGAGQAGGEGRLPLRQRVLGAVKFFTRYALLAVGAYVMLTCFRLHPAGVLAGAVSPFLAALAQVVRMSRSLSRPERPL